MNTKFHNAIKTEVKRLRKALRVADAAYSKAETAMHKAENRLLALDDDASHETFKKAKDSLKAADKAYKQADKNLGLIYREIDRFQSISYVTY